MKKLFFYLIIFPAFFLLFGNTVQAGTCITAGLDQTAAVKHDGTVWAWGGNGWGELGDGTTTDSSTPVQVSGLSNITQIAAGMGYTVALKQDETVWAWGYNPNGHLGDGTQTYRHTPVQASGLLGVTTIAAQYIHTVALKQDGTVWAWGGTSPASWVTERRHKGSRRSR